MKYEDRVAEAKVGIDKILSQHGITPLLDALAEHADSLLAGQHHGWSTIAIQIWIDLSHTLRLLTHATTKLAGIDLSGRKL